MRFWTPHREGLLPHTELHSDLSIHFLVSRRPPSFLPPPLFLYKKIIFSIHLHKWTFSIFFFFLQRGNPSFVSYRFSFIFCVTRVLRNVQAKSCKFSSCYKEKPHNVSSLPHNSSSFLPSFLSLSLNHTSLSLKLKFQTHCPSISSFMTSINQSRTSLYPTLSQPLAQPQIDPHIR